MTGITSFIIRFIMGLQWTTKPPTQEGSYWARLRHINEIQVVLVFIGVHNLDEVTFITFSGFGGKTVERHVDEVSHWLGPLPVPALPNRKKGVKR